MDTSFRRGPLPLSTCLAALLYNALGVLCGQSPVSPEPFHVGSLAMRLLGSSEPRGKIEHGTCLSGYIAVLQWDPIGFRLYIR
jgi:hypothetical protein